MMSSEERSDDRGVLPEGKNLNLVFKTQTQVLRVAQDDRVKSFSMLRPPQKKLTFPYTSNKLTQRKQIYQ